jgi:flagellar M-ring protein FliF
MGSLGPIVAQLRSLWGRLSRTQQMALIGIAGGALVFSFIILKMGGGTQTYVTAFTNLDPKDSNAAVEQLKADGIPYQVSPDGGTIKVPSDKLADARLKLAAKGLPQGGSVGFELFDKTSFGQTDFVQHLNYQRALEGELSRTINTLSQVEGSRVHIVVPKQELFVSQQKPATASVVLQLRPGRPMDEGTLRGIAHMVSRSVQGLSETNITILDTSGKLLFNGDQSDSGAGLTATQLDVQKKLEKSIEGELQTLLDQVAGPNRSAVRVKADMDFSQQESQAETFTPGGQNNQGVARSSASVQETYSGQGAAPGQAGAAANVPGANSVAGAAGGPSSYQRQETTTNFEVNRTTTKTVRGPGEVKRLSVSVMLDSSIGEADAAGLRDVIAAAAGIDQRRGDQIVVTTAAFSGNRTADIIPAARPGPLDAYLPYLKMGVPLLAALIVVFAVWRMSRSVSPKGARARAYAGQLALPAPAASTREWIAGLDDALANPELPTQAVHRIAAPADETPDEVKRRNEIQERMVNLAAANPDGVADIIQRWMAQDERR